MKEGKSYVHNLKVERPPVVEKPIPVQTAQSAFTTQYNASRYALHAAANSGAVKSASRTSKKQPVGDVYYEKLPAINNKKSASVGTH